MVSDSDAEKENSTSPEASSPGNAPAKSPAHILDEVLEEPEDPISSHYRHPIAIDIMLAVGLLVIMGAFSAGLIKMYVSHSAEQSITQRNYQAAIALLEGAPFPDLFSPPGSEPRELLNQALYLDAMEKLDAYSEDSAAIKELEKIDASSRFFELAQEILKEHFKPSSIQLQGGAAEAEKVQPAADHNAANPADTTNNAPAADETTGTTTGTGNNTSSP
jgi:hypothetical protein